MYYQIGFEYLRYASVFQIKESKPSKIERVDTDNFLSINP